jgi:1L-myo-inositol 1-phosphate cytidylyltransferase / CDP-L-myo-inositol myo-inositolphosphotransferase
VEAVTEARAAVSSLLLIPADDAGVAAAASPGTILLGLPLLRRNVLAASRAGFGRILVLTRDTTEVKSLLNGTPATVMALGEPIVSLPPGRIVLLAANVLSDAKWLGKVAEMSITPGQLYGDGETVAVIDPVDPRVVASVVSCGVQAPDLFDKLRQSVKTVYRPLDHEGIVPLATAHDIRKAEKWLLRGLIKETEGFMSRYVERRISLAITRWLVSTPITPSAMTTVSVGIGLLGAPFFLSASPAYQLTGALLFLAHSILDGCDGELARLRFQESRWGGLIDFWGDNVVHAAVFSCMAVGWSLVAGTMWPLVFGTMAVAGAVGSAGFVYWHTMREKRSDGPLFTSVVRSPRRGVSRLLDALARRDFIYIIVLLSIFGKAAWFLVLAAIGAPIFLLLLLWTARGDSHYKERVS